eukprot:3672341-Heterocapsa_arctica.AAC.1
MELPPLQHVGLDNIDLKRVFLSIFTSLISGFDIITRFKATASTPSSRLCETHIFNKVGVKYTT